MLAPDVPLSLAPARLHGSRLAIPGIIGVPSAVSFGKASYVLTGPHAGFPEFQPLDEWKSYVSLADHHALAPDVREAAGIELPEAVLARIADEDREMEAVDLPGDLFHDDAMRGRLLLAASAPMLPLPERAPSLLDVRGVPYWRAGYSRISGAVWLEWRAPAGWRASFGVHDVNQLGVASAGGLARDAYQALFWSVWVSRALRALSGGAVSEQMVLFARAHAVGWHAVPLARDAVVAAGVEARVRIDAREDWVDVPLHGRARRVAMPPFELRVWDADPFSGDEAAAPARTFLVPREDVWWLGR